MNSAAQRPETLLQSQSALLTAQGLQIALGFVLTVALVRTLSDAAFGTFVFASAWMIMAARVVDAGISPALVKGLVDLPSAQEQGAGLWHRVFSLRLGIAVIFALVTPLVFISNADLALSVYWRFGIGVTIAISIFALPLRSWHQRFAALRKNRWSAWISFGAQSFQVSLALLALGLFGARALPFVLIALALREFSNSIVAWGWGRRRLRPLASVAFGVRSELGTSGLVSLSLATVATALYFHVDVFMIEAWRGSEEVARYGLALRVLAPLLAAVHLLSAPILPFVVGAKRSGTQARVLISAMAVVGFATVPIAAALYFGPGVVDLLSGRKSDPAGGLLSSLSIVPLAVVAGALSSATLIALGKSKIWALLAVTGLALNLGLNALWIPDYGAEGAAWATAVTEAFVGLLSFITAVGILAKSGDRLQIGISPRFLISVGLLLVTVLGFMFGLDGSKPWFALAIWVFAAVAALTWTYSPPAKALRRRIEAEGIES